jgi:hypothetical protein
MPGINGAAQRLHLERLRLWQQLTGVELHNVCCVNIPHLRRELREAIKQVRRSPRLNNSFFRDARLELLEARSVTTLLKLFQRL